MVAVNEFPIGTKVEVQGYTSKYEGMKGEVLKIKQDGDWCWHRVELVSGEILLLTKYEMRVIE